ncbi:hypothetical protein ANCCAN_22640 [Ancylostoma caninum]|uniref:ATP-dependent DNA helicase n=1 Tax=Ancylostoma caninum TaxID=29170 RepID=A0A368FL34_ANCCA|nr:hypothetical protein ANCCAN_22640 [Ancylostoma caninum]
MFALLKQSTMQEAMEEAANKDTTLTAWFKLNEEYERKEQEGVDLQGVVDPRTLYYTQIPEFFTFVQQTREWKIRQHGTRQIGRMYVATPRVIERFSLQDSAWLPLLHRKNIHSSVHLRTVENILYPTFTETARARRLLHDDTHYGECLEEASLFQLPTELHALFGYMLAFCDISEPQQLFDRFKACMAEDFVHRGYSQTKAEALVYYDLSGRLAALQYNFSEQVTLPVLPRSEFSSVEEYHRTKRAELYACLNFIDGPGGSGKTYIYNAMYHILKGQQKSVVAWTGIAGSLLPERRTASSTFKLNMASGNRDCAMRREDRDAATLKEADAIIWDEISMVPKFSLEAVDLLLQDLMCNALSFGGKTIVIGGDFRQVLPIIERGRESDMVDACVKNSRLWSEFHKHSLVINVRAASSGASWYGLFMGIGNGEFEQDNEGRI